MNTTTLQDLVAEATATKKKNTAPQLRGAERRAAQWLRRFTKNGPAMLLSNTSGGEYWVTDTYRAHRAPLEVRELLRAGDLRTIDGGGRFTVNLTTGVAKVAGTAPLSSTLTSLTSTSRIEPTRAAEGVVFFSYQDEEICLNADYVADAIADGATKWAATGGTLRPVLALDAQGQVVAYIMPRRH